MNAFLLIDFGASYIKTVKYHNKAFSEPKATPSPFNKKTSINVSELFDCVKTILKQYDDCDKVVCCTIMGGGYRDNTYYSWKSSIKNHNKIDLISGLFTQSDDFHRHADHDIDGITGLKKIGTLYSKIFYTPLADTECVRRSVELKKNEFMVNLGTGSQILGISYTHSFIPSGRAFNVYNRFFNSFGFNMFDYFSTLSMTDIELSDMNFNLNVFDESHLYSDGGEITKITESGFNKNNFFSSLFRSYLNQYVEILKNLKPSKVYLTGGISRKYPIIKTYLQKELQKNVVLLNNKHEDTHVGLASFVEKHL